MATTAFAELARAVARDARLATLALASVEHPVREVGEDVLERRIAEATDHTAELLGG